MWSKYFIKGLFMGIYKLENFIIVEERVAFKFSTIQELKRRQK